MTAMDNVVAYVEGEGEAPIGPQPDFFAFAANDNAFLSLVTVPDVASFQDLKGKTVSVDARTTGFAFILFEMLRRNGLGEESYTVESVGSTFSRWQALSQKKQAGTLLLPPFDAEATAQGFHVLARANQAFGSY